MKPNSPIKNPLQLAAIALAMLTMGTFTACRSNQHSIYSTDPVVIMALANAASIAPDLDVEKIDREKEFGKTYWTVEGKVRGQKVEVEFEELKGSYPSPKNTIWK